MSVQLDITSRNARLDALIASIGAAPTLNIRTGSKPADCAAAPTGTLLASMTLPSTWMNAAFGGQATMTGTWADLSADASGDAGYFRILAGGTCRMQGTITATGGGGDMQVANITLVVAQAVDVTLFTLTDGGA